MKKYLYIVIILISFKAKTQIVYGGLDADKSSVMDLQSQYRGFLLPRVSLTGTNDVTTIANPAKALMVFNTVAQSDVQVGFYYYSTDNGRWVSVSGIQTTHTMSIHPISGLLTSVVNGVSATASVLANSSNGLTNVNGVVQLGGVLTEPTTIGTSATNTLAINGLPVGVNTDNILLSRGGVLKTISGVDLNLPSSVETNVLKTTGNTLTSAVNGVSATSAVIRSNALGLSADDILTSVVNGVNATASVSIPIDGFKNKFINANFAINQREGIGVATQYKADQWFTSSTVSLVSTRVDSGKKVVFATAGGNISQKIEDVHVSVGDYTLSWYGNVTPSSDKFTVSNISPYVNPNIRRTAKLNLATWTAGVHPQITFTATMANDTLSKPQLEPGVVASAFERRSYNEELQLCQRYCQPVYLSGPLTKCSNTILCSSIAFPVEMAKSPQVLYNNTNPLNVFNMLYEQPFNVYFNIVPTFSRITPKSMFVSLENRDSTNKWDEISLNVTITSVLGTSINVIFTRAITTTTFISPKFLLESNL